MKKKRERNSFLTPLDVRVLKGGKKFMVLNGFTYVWKRAGKDTIVIHVKHGFVTDFASIPRLLRILIPKLGRHNKPAVIHDFLYSLAAVAVGLTRQEADQCFLDGMIEQKVTGWQASLMYWSVRIGGWMAWRKR